MKVPRLAFHLTDRCQLDCQHCLRDPARKARDIDLETIAQVIRDARALYGIEQVTFTGGEPTLHPNFDAVVDLVVDHGMSWNMVTNGRAFPVIVARLERRRERLAGLNSIALSLDGANEVTHDAIREHGSYREVLAAAAICATRKIPFDFHMTVQARNELELEALGFLAAQLGARRVLYGMMQPTGTPHDAALFLPASAWRRVRGRIEGLAKALSITVELAEGHYEEARFATCEPWRGEVLHIDVEGRLSMCCLHSQVPSTEPPGRDVVGSLRELGLVEAHRRLLDLVRRAEDEALASLDGQDPSEWDHFHCNRCLARFGKPHWTTEGASGPTARRERWHGAWAPGEHRHALGSDDAEAGKSPRRLRLIN